MTRQPSLATQNTSVLAIYIPYIKSTYMCLLYFVLLKKYKQIVLKKYKQFYCFLKYFYNKNTLSSCVFIATRFSGFISKCTISQGYKNYSL